MQLKQSRILWLILAVSLLARVAAAIAVDWHVEKQGRRFLIEGDANGYWELGQKIAAGETYAIHTPPRYVLRTPGFPLLLAVPIRLFGDRVLPATIILAAVGTGCVWLTYLLGRRVASETTALFASSVVAVAPLHVGNSILILSETWFAFWMLIAMLIFQRLPGTWQANSDRKARISDVERSSLFRDWATAFAAGLATGCGVLVRPGWILWPGVAALLLLTFGTGPFFRRILLAAVLGCGCFAALTPWAWRNHEVTGHWVMTSLWSGPSLYDGLHPEATGASDMQFFDDEKLPLQMSEYEVNETYKTRAWRYARENPGRAIELGLIKAGRYLSLSPNAAGFSSGPFYLICLAVSLVSGVFLAIGIWVQRKTLGICVFLLAPFLQFLLVHMVFIGSVRYRLPVEFPLAILVGAGMESMRNRIMRVEVSCEDEHGKSR